MNDDGFTLSDTLAALAIIGLAMGGVVTGGALLAKAQGRTDIRVARVAGLKRASVALDDLLAQAGPFRSRDAVFEGAPRAFSFSCGQAGRCGARLAGEGQTLALAVTRASGAQETIALKGVASAHFLYVGGVTEGDAWPRPAARPERLRQLALVDDADESPLVQALLPIDQPTTCEFDVVSQDCR